jgi:hypothetical protein
MSTFERAFTDTERAAESAVKAATSLLATARQMQKAAQEGNISSLRRTSERLQSAASLIQQEVSNAVNAWPFTPESEENYLRESYTSELLSRAGAEQLIIHQRDDRLICFPSILRVLPADKAVRIDKKRVPQVRPSKLVAILKDNQTRPRKFRSEVFLEAIYRVYRNLVSRSQPGRLMDDDRIGPVITLARIYEMLTSLPGSTREYDSTDFARDLYLVDTGGIRKVRSGATISFPASTGTRSQRGTFSFVSAEGEVVTYYGVQFTEAAS